MGVATRFGKKLRHAVAQRNFPIILHGNMRNNYHFGDGPRVTKRYRGGY